MGASEQSLYSRCIEVLGKPKEDASFDALVKLLKREPTMVMENDYVSHHEFEQSGIELIFSKARGCFGAVVFFINSPNVKQGQMQPYKGGFLSDVTPADSIASIERKIDSVATHGQFPKESTLAFNLPTHSLTFYFDVEGTEMSLALVKHKFA
jgi:hypothetical protein